MASDDEFLPYLVCKRDGAAVQSALWALDEKQQALAIFMTQQSASRYLQAMQLDASWYVYQPARGDLHDVFRRCCQAGIEHAVLDPDDQSAARLFNLSDILAAAAEEEN